MREQLEARLSELQNDFEVGERQLRELEVQQARLRDTLLRINGAVQVLQELLANGTSEVRNGSIEDQEAGSAVDVGLSGAVPTTKHA